MIFFTAVLCPLRTAGESVLSHLSLVINASSPILVLFFFIFRVQYSKKTVNPPCVMLSYSCYNWPILTFFFSNVHRAWPWCEKFPMEVQSHTSPWLCLIWPFILSAMYLFSHYQTNSKLEGGSVGVLVSLTVLWNVSNKREMHIKLCWQGPSLRVDPCYLTEGARHFLNRPPLAQFSW